MLEENEIQSTETLASQDENKEILPGYKKFEDFTRVSIEKQIFNLRLCV